MWSTPGVRITASIPWRGVISITRPSTSTKSPRRARPRSPSTAVEINKATEYAAERCRRDAAAVAAAQAASRRRGHAQRLRDAGTAAAPGARANGTARHFDRPAGAVAAVRRVRARGRRPPGRDQPACRRAGQCRITEADRRHSVRQARPAGRYQDQDRTMGDRRAAARGTGRAGPSAAAKDPRLAPGVEAEIDLHRRVAGLRSSDNASRAHQLRAGRDDDRPAVVVRAELAEHSDPHRGRSKNPPRLHRRTGPSSWSRPTIRRSSCGSLPRSPKSRNCGRRFATASTSMP